MTVRRIIEVDTLDDLATFVAEQAEMYEQQAASYKKSRAANPRHFTKVQIAESQGTAHGLRLAERIVKDTVFRDS